MLSKSGTLDEIFPTIAEYVDFSFAPIETGECQLRDVSCQLVRLDSILDDVYQLATL